MLKAYAVAAILATQCQVEADTSEIYKPTPRAPFSGPEQAKDKPRWKPRTLTTKTGEQKPPCRGPKPRGIRF